MMPMRRCCDDVRCRGCQCGRALAGLAIAAMIVTSTPGATTDQAALSATVSHFLAMPPLEEVAATAAVSVRIVPLELASQPTSAFGD
jgi:hypothetical protein